MQVEPTPDSTAADGTPKRLGRYRLVRPISTGGMARVFEARRESLAGVSPRVAIKVILPDFADNRPFQELFVHEARIGSMLMHQNVVQIQDFDCQDGVYYLVMEYVDGITLRRITSLCRRHGIPVPLDIIADLGRQVCDGLSHAHHAVDEDENPLNLVHRDIKPSNLMVNPQGVAKVLDFGISKALTRRETQGAVRGTWGYMSPEQADGEAVGPAADLFGLAAVLYELAAVGPLFTEKEPDVVKALLGQDEAARRAARLPRGHAPLARILVRALQRDPAARYENATDMGRALGELMTDPVTARERLVDFQEKMVALNQPGITARKKEEPAKPDNDPASRTSQYTSSSPGLPIAIGDSDGPVRPIRRTGAATHPSEPISIGDLVLPLFLTCAVAIMGYTSWQLWQERAATAPAAELAETDVVPVAPAPESAKPVQSIAKPAAQAQATPPPAASPVAIPSGTGLLTVSTLPRSKVYVDGEFQRYSPLFKTGFDAGQHTVRLVTDDGREHTFDVRIKANREVHRIWSFDEGDWVGTR